MSQSEFESPGNDTPRLFRRFEVRGVNRVDSSDVVEIETPEIDRGTDSKTAGEDGFNLGEVRVGQFEVAIRDPLLRLHTTNEEGGGKRKGPKRKSVLVTLDSRKCEIWDEETKQSRFLFLVSTRLEALYENSQHQGK